MGEDDAFIGSIGLVLGRPTKIMLQSNNRYRYDAPIEHYYANGKTYYKDIYSMTVITTMRAGFVITAWADYNRTVQCPSLPPC
jgi:hypothetical protein